MEWQDCWNPHTRFEEFVSDLSAAQGDSSHNSNPQPANGDLVSGVNSDLPTFWYGYKGTAAPHPGTYVDSGGVTRSYVDSSTLCSNNNNAPGCEPATLPVLYLAMRLDATPLLTTTDYPGEAANGPFSSNTAWNFIFDVNGDGWSDLIASVDGNKGTNQDPFDDIVVAFNGETDSQEYNEDFTGQASATQLCQDTPPGDILNFHDTNRFNGPAVGGCVDAGADADCNFGITRVLRVDTDQTSGDPDYILMMQIPLSWMDDCRSAANTDGDAIAGNQLLDIDKPFSMCVTTSTQPNDYTNKDLAFRGTYVMKKDKPVVCSDNCSLGGGCQQEPVVADTEVTCGQTPNTTTLTVEILDTLTTSGTTASDSIATVAFYYAQDTVDDTWTFIGNATRSLTSLSTWSFNWNTTSIPLSPSSLYHIRAVVTDDQGNVTDLSPVSIDLATCDVEVNPVTLSSFRAVRDGRRVTFEWTTETEVGNLGFNILSRSADGKWEPINEGLIRSKGIDSAEPQVYSFEAWDVDGEAFAIEDVDVRGRATSRGPLEPRGTTRLRASVAAHRHGEEHRPVLEATTEPATAVRVGGAPVMEEIDWQAIRASRGRVERSASLQARVSAARGGGASSPAIELLVSRDGLHRVTYEQLAAAGVDFGGAQAQHLALLSRGAAVPIRVVSGKTFGPGSWIEFRGVPAGGLYTETNVYQLQVDAKRAKRIAQSTASASGAAPAVHMATVVHERDRAYGVTAPGSDPWYDSELVAFGGGAGATFEITADRLVPGAGAGTLEVDLWGVTAWANTPDHHVRVLVNGTPVADAHFDGQIEHRVTATVPDGVLQEGSNQVRIELPNDLGFPWDVVYLDDFSLTYPRAFVADGDGLRFTAAGSAYEVGGLSSATVEVWRLDDTPVRLTASTTAGSDGFVARFPGSGASASYLVAAPGSILTPELRAARPPADLLSGPADYLVISHGDFLQALQPLVVLRQNDGLDVKVVDVADVYAQFGHGVFGVEAIQAYIRAVAPALGVRYVLLVGGDTYDYADRLGLGSISFVPSPYVRTGDIVSYAPADPLYGDLDGDNVPELAVGRLPVRTPAELTTLIGKIAAYRNSDYHGTAVFAADVWDMAYEVSYSAMSDRLIDTLPPGWSAERAYLEGGAPQAKAQLLESMNSGVALTSWMGHSGFTIWSLHRMFSATEASQLANYGRPTIVSQWGCWNNYHVSPRYETLGHKLLLSGDQGAAAVLGSATLSEAESQALLSRLVTPLLVQPGKTIGDAMVQAKRQLALTDPARIDVILGWTLLGDPAMQVQP